MEMDQWWEQHSDVEMGDYDRSDVEDTTGCIPLLLDRCVIGGRIDLNLADLHEMYHEAAQFALQVRDRTMKDEHDWQWYVRLIQRRLTQPQAMTDFSGIANSWGQASFRIVNIQFRIINWSTIGTSTGISIRTTLITAIRAVSSATLSQTEFLR